MSKLRRSAAIGLAAVCLAAGAASQTFPYKQVRIIAPVEPGSPTDTIARLVAQKLSNVWGQPVVIDNKPSVNGVVGADIAAKAAPDGYTLLAGNSGTQVMNVGLYKKLSYHPAVDFASVAQLVTSPLVLMGSNHFAATRVSEVIAQAKSSSMLNFAVPGATAQLATLMFNSAAGLDIMSIPYKGSSGAETALLAGDAQLFFASVSNALPYAQSGRMKTLAVTSLERSPALPSVPTLHESGLPGYEIDYWVGLFAPAGAPSQVLDKINEDVAKILRSPETRNKLVEMGYSPTPRSRVDFDRYVKGSIERYGKLMAKLGIQPQ
jgi:tripartite-type tricarboxylate transporter receptor subunit TctC